MGIHSIIVIKNAQGKYLQYFDKRWNCYLFPNCKLPNNAFKLNEIEYKWFSYSELMSNERIKKVNSDIIRFVKEFNM